MSRTIDIFGTKFCVPKEYDVKRGFVLCKIPIEQDFKSGLTRPIIKKEELRQDIDKLWDYFQKNPTKAEIERWLTENPI